MVDHIIAKIILGQIRHFIGIAGGALVSHGLLTSDQGQQFDGALLALVPLAFSAYDKWQANNAANTAILAAAKGAKGDGSPD